MTTDFPDSAEGNEEFPNVADLGGLPVNATIADLGQTAILSRLLSCSSPVLAQC